MKEENTITLEETYLKTLPQKEFKAYLIAKDHLGMSFQLDKSIGFLTWKKTKEAENK